jgi:hypothetical protein
MIPEPHDDQQISDLLSRLGAQTPDYPADLLEKRRAAYYQSMAALGIGLAGGEALGGPSAGAGDAGMLSGLSVDTILKALIALALVVEAVGGVVLYRRYIAQNELLRKSATLTAELSAMPTGRASGSPVGTFTVTPTPTTSTTATMTPALTGSPGSTQPAPTATKPGRRLGHTPTPPGHRDTPRP